MVSLSTTLARLSRMQQPGSPSGMTDRLHDLTGFAPDPGNLRARMYVPADLKPGAALVVAMHGCTQDAAIYDHGTGWSTLAEREGFAVLFPEQRRANNANMCFNWFEAADIARIGGEAESIAAMIDAAIAAHDIDPARVFVTGLSAGGAMTAVMLAAWPDRFAAGAIIGGLPYGSAIGVRAAMERMRGQSLPDARSGAAAVRSVAGRAPMPRVAIWHGTADTTVVVGNLDALVAQWCGVHDLSDATPETTAETGWRRRTWRDGSGAPLVDEWRVAGMGHGVPVDTASGIGHAGPFMLDVGLSSTIEIARSWGLTDAVAPVATPRPTRTIRPEPMRPEPTQQHQQQQQTEVSGVQATIERALRSAGLMR
ncbi:hypothetical protein ASE73_10050 [Sphingomonas sp. Leaf24]|uniref:extracellular catalytic domain type 1 short-chain-length polyhydroxyalkanoate depolymerase n=1 Tax=unclassified Sphingomonas TaxID=196159 RepID=UPI0006FB4B6B|nr:MULTISPECIES: PHB depolymerase family esterase [unclassified Sphingomonas]KQM14505.1 hypothetical protein ASE50_08100 [Sphingomonas sp. Leaf5]KQM87806.1 hypothetical protein ASE73_10050 [Sphingomonas sp. Leaf24]